MTTCKGCRWLVMIWAESRRSLRQARRSWAERGGGQKQKPALPSQRRRISAKTGPTGPLASATCGSNAAAEPASEPDFALACSLRSRLSSATSQRTRRGRGRLGTRFAAYRGRRGVGLDAAKQAAMAALKGEKRK